MAIDKGILFENIQSMASQGAEPEEIRGYISSIGENPDDYISSPEISVEPEKTGVLGKISENVKNYKPYDFENSKEGKQIAAISDPSTVVQILPMLATGGKSIPAQMAVQGAATGLSGIARELFSGKDLKEAVTEGIDEGFWASLITGALGAGGKILPPIAKGVGRRLTGISPIPEEKIYEAVARPKDIFQKGWTKAGSKIDELADILSSKVKNIKNASEKAISDIAESNIAAKEKNKLISEQVKKSNSDLANQAGIAANNVMKDIESKAGSVVGDARKALKEGAKESTLYGDDMAKEVDSILKEGTIVDPSGETSYMSPSEISFLKDIKKELMGNIERGQAKSSVLDPIFGPMITTKETMSRAPISPARISTIIGKIDNFVTYGPKYSSDVVTTEGEFLLKKARNVLNEKLRSLSPEIAQANDNSFLVKEIKSSLQSRTDKSISGLIKDYHNGNIFPRQKEALEKLQGISGVNFLEQSIPKQADFLLQKQIPYEIKSQKDLLSSLSSLSTQRGARGMMQNFSKMTPEESAGIKSLLGEEGDALLSKIKDLDIAKDFIRKRPSLYGALGSAGPAIALGNTSKPLAIAATLGAVGATSPRVNSYIVRSLPYTKAGVNLISKGARMAVPIASRKADGSMSSNIYEEYQKSRRER